MKISKKNKRKWSRAFSQALIGIWNCWLLSNERYHYCESLNYDILGLTELHNVQTKFQGRRWICSAAAETSKDGKSTDPAAGVAIMLSARMADKVMSEGHVGTRIAWVRIKGPVCNIFFIVVYIPHKGRQQKPRAQDTIAQLKSLLQSIRKSDCVVLGGDFNCQLQRNVPDCTGQWSMTEKSNKNGHGDEILSLLKEYDPCAVDTYFKPAKKRWRWRGKQRRTQRTFRRET